VSGYDPELAEILAQLRALETNIAPSPLHKGERVSETAQGLIEQLISNDIRRMILIDQARKLLRDVETQ